MRFGNASNFLVFDVRFHVEVLFEAACLTI